jgi:nucleoside-diphosphate-sugar epimerase
MFGLGWRPQVGLADGIGRAYADYLSTAGRAAATAAA